MIGFVGLGSMGLPMVKRLIASGHDVLVFDTDAAKIDLAVQVGATAARSTRAMTDQAETVLCSLPIPSVVTAVVTGDGGLLGGSALRMIIDLSTTGPTVTATLAEAALAQGVDLVDAPVSGGVAGAAAGTLTIMVAGKAAAVAAAMPIVECLGSRIFAMGDRAGLGQSMKLVNNLLCAVSAAAVFEAVVMGTKAGLDPARMVDVLNVSSGRSFVTQEKLPQSVLPRGFPLRFTTGLLAKDVRLALDMARDTGVDQSMGQAASALLEAALARGEADRDYTTLIQYFETLAGVTVGQQEEPTT